MAGPCASAERLIDEAFNGASASAAFGAAAEAAVDLLWIARKVLRGVDGVTNIVVAEDVAGTNNHENEKALWVCGAIDIQDRGERQKEKPCFQAIPNWAQHTLE
jgi:hypothetical protein